MVRARGSFFLGYTDVVRIAALGGTAFLVAMLVAPARADWAVKRQSREPLIDQIARELQAHPADRQLATRLARAAPKATLERLLDAFAARASRAGDDPEPVLAYAQFLLAAGRAPEAAAAFERASGASSLTVQVAAYEGWAMALRTTGDRAQAVAMYQRALGVEKRPPERRRLLHLLVAAAGDPQQLDSEVAARRELATLEPGSDETALALVDALERAGQPRQAAQVLEDRLARRRSETGPTLIALRLRVAALYESAGALDRAAEILAETEHGLPAGDVRRRREVWLRIMEIARRRGTLAELAKQLEAPGLERGPAEWESLSEVRDELGDLNGALEAARHAQSRQPRDVEIGRRVAALLDRLGREDEVTAELAALARLAPSDPRFTIDVIERQFRTATKEEARAELDRAIARFGNNPSALGQLADLAGRWSENRRALDAWQRLLRLSPHDEMAILGLGEVQFQAHKKDAAIHTWQALRSGRSSKADGSARLAEVLMEHDLLDEATAEVEQAEALEPKEPRHRRLMAQILERQRRPDAAIAEWERVMAMNVGPTHAAERREARSRILGILGREGRARLEDKIGKLRAEVEAHPERRETALFLAEAELRSDAITGAIDTLRATIARDRAHAAGGADASDDAQAEVILTLVRLLRQTRQLDEAVRLLAELAQRIPSRAREAHIQIADIELGRYEDQQALDHASSAARLAPDDGRALIRIAEVQERAGEIDAALANYRRAFGRDANPSAAFALARLLTRRGSTAEASEILRGVLRAGSDEETITETGRRAIDLEEYLGTLDDLERVVSGLLFSNPNGAAYRRLLAEIYRRLLPSQYRAPAAETAAAENRARIAQHGLRPLLELVTEADGDPERGLIELLGMLGNRDAAPALARLAQGLGRFGRRGAAAHVERRWQRDATDRDHRARPARRQPCAPDAGDAGRRARHDRPGGGGLGARSDGGTRDRRAARGADRLAPRRRRLRLPGARPHRRPALGGRPGARGTGPVAAAEAAAGSGGGAGTVAQPGGRAGADVAARFVERGAGERRRGRARRARRHQPAAVAVRARAAGSERDHRRGDAGPGGDRPPHRQRAHRGRGQGDRRYAPGSRGDARPADAATDAGRARRSRGRLDSALA